MKQSLFSHLHRARTWFAPAGSKREKVLKMIVQSFRILKNEGFSSVYRKVIQKISGWLFSRKHRATSTDQPHPSRKDGLTISSLDLRAVSKVQLIPSSYDVIVMTRTDWHVRLQRTQQIAKRFAQEGHRIFYVSPTLKKRAQTKVCSIGNGVFEVQPIVPESVKVYDDAISDQGIDAILDAFKSLRNELDIVDTTCVVDAPIWSSIAFSLRDRFGWRVIYDCVDSSYDSDEPSGKIGKNEERLLQNSDLVFASSPSLLDEVKKRNPNCLLVPGVDDVSDFQFMDSVPSLFPKVSIIVVTYNNVEYTRLCLKSIYEKTIHPNFEVIVVDNASTDGTPEFLRTFESEHNNFRTIYNARNGGFAQANNQGIAAANGNYIVLLNNDTVVTRVWLSRLINHLRDQRVGLVGSVSNGVSNEAHVEMSFTDIDGLDVFATQLAKERSDILTPIKMLAMYCVAGRKEIFQQIGTLDEQFGIGMFEDDDYSLRVRQAGYMIAVAEDVFVQHFSRSGFKILGDERYLALFEENRRKFEAKWNIKWKQHVGGTLAENRRFVSDLQSILDTYPDVSGVVIFPPTIGWNISLFQRPHQLARTFAKMGYLVFFCTEAQVDDIQGFKQISHGLYLANSPWAVYDLVEHPIIFTLPYNCEYAFQLRQPLIVYEVIDDLDVFPGDKAQLLKNHDILLKEAEIVVVTADRLMEQVKQIRPDAIICPNAVELEHFSQTSDSDLKAMPPDLEAVIKRDRPVIGYYGALARWFDYDLVRQAAQKHSDWDFVLIGPNHDHTLMASNILSVPNIHWLGARDYGQLPSYLRQFSVATIPFLVNDITLATSPIKLFEYMAARKPIVTSDLPECRKYPGVFVAHSAKEYVDQLEYALTLATDTIYLQQLYQTAQENTWEVRVSQIVDALEDIKIVGFRLKSCPPNVNKL
jgi:GT2 family glycosyltransferase